jgi:hypothetical protein
MKTLNCAGTHDAAAVLETEMIAGHPPTANFNLDTRERHFAAWPLLFKGFPR